MDGFTNLKPAHLYSQLKHRLLKSFNALTLYL